MRAWVYACVCLVFVALTVFWVMANVEWSAVECGGECVGDVDFDVLSILNLLSCPSLRGCCFNKHAPKDNLNVN